MNDATLYRPSIRLKKICSGYYQTADERFTVSRSLDHAGTWVLEDRLSTGADATVTREPTKKAVVEYMQWIVQTEGPRYMDEDGFPVDI